MPDDPEVPDDPLVPFPDVPLEPDVPASPLVPEEPLVPASPDVPLEPDVPEEPLVPPAPLVPTIFTFTVSSIDASRVTSTSPVKFIPLVFLFIKTSSSYISEIVKSSKKSETDILKEAISISFCKSPKFETRLLTDGNSCSLSDLTTIAKAPLPSSRY